MDCHNHNERSSEHNQPNQSSNLPSPKTNGLTWLPWLLVIVLAGMMVFYYIAPPGNAEAGSKNLSWLPILIMSLACPLMMLFMPRHGRNGGGGCCHPQENPNESDANKAPRR